MSNKLDLIKEKLATQREILRGFIIVMIALATGLSSLIINVTSGKLPIYMLLFVGLCFVGLAIFGSITKSVYTNIKKLYKELENA
jgi:hypothetical protein